MQHWIHNASHIMKRSKLFVNGCQLYFDTSKYINLSIQLNNIIVHILLESMYEIKKITRFSLVFRGN